jgi:tetratricopeptide (TPR) repeat protein
MTSISQGKRLLQRGDNYCWDGHYVEAQQVYQEAADIFKSKRGGKLSMHLASAYLGIGIAYYAQHLYDEAIHIIKKSIKILKWRPVARLSLKMASNYHFMALALDEKHEYDKALVYFKRTIQIQQVLAPQTLKLACSYHDYGLAFRHRKNPGDYELALKYTRLAADIREKTTPSSISLAATYDNLAYIFREQGNPEEEIVHSLKSIEIREATSPECPILSLRYTNLGAAYHNKGNYAQAVEYAKKAIQIQEQEDYPERLLHCLALSIHVRSLCLVANIITTMVRLVYTHKHTHMYCYILFAESWCRLLWHGQNECQY